MSKKSTKGSKKKKRKNWWDTYQETQKPKKEPKKVKNVKPKKGSSKKFVTKDKKTVTVQNKTDRSAKEAKGLDIKLYEELARVNTAGQETQMKAVNSLLTYGWFQAWLKSYCESRATDRGQIPTEFPVIQRSQSSCEITRDAKGGIKFVVKAYADSSLDACKEAIINFNKVVDAVDEEEDE